MPQVRATHRGHKEGDCDDGHRRDSEYTTSTTRGGGGFPHWSELRSALLLARSPPTRGIYPSHAGCAAQEGCSPRSSSPLLDPQVAHDAEKQRACRSRPSRFSILCSIPYGAPGTFWPGSFFPWVST